MYTCEFLVLTCFSILETGLCEEYQVPYFDMLPGDPSFDEVKKVVLTEKKRPSVPNRWYRDEVRFVALYLSNKSNKRTYKTLGIQEVFSINFKLLAHTGVN